MSDTINQDHIIAIGQSSDTKNDEFNTTNSSFVISPIW